MCHLKFVSGDCEWMAFGRDGILTKLKGERHGMDDPAIRRDRAELRNQLLRERTILSEPFGHRARKIRSAIRTDAWPSHSGMAVEPFFFPLRMRVISV